MKNLKFIIYQPYKWLIFIPFLAINTIIFGLLAVLISLAVNKKLGSFIGGAVWSRVNAFFTPVFVSVKGRENIAKGQSYVVVANHESAYDIFVLYGWLGIDFKWVMKKEIRKIPGIGFGSEAVGHIFIDRSSSKSAIETIEAAKQRIRGGTSVVFFPEGTRSRTRELLPFKKGAYRFAYDLNLPILPVSINGTRKIFPPDSLNLMPGKAEIIIHPPIDISLFEQENISSLIAESRRVIESARREL
jgi:1-acyl-sn-glycerol-3-phosphate acyltransferase